MADLKCSICGGRSFREQAVLWPQLVSEWQLARHEEDYVNRQQGTQCTTCGASLRIIALGKAVLAMLDADGSLREAVAGGLLDAMQILDCNGAEGISATLAGLPGYVRADYPEYDMRALPFADGSFDLVLHSDTLEHIEHPLAALEECRRVLASSGRLCFTVPMIVGRLTRGRAGLAPSYHGEPQEGRDDFLVHTEFGADAWTLVHQAGFTNLMLNAVEYPSAIAISAWNDRRRVVPDDVVAPVPPAEAPEDQAISEPASAIGAYDQDGLRSIHNHEFMADPVFQAAYARGVQAAGVDYNWHWRVHAGLWAARMAAHLPGDFAEFGVNRGFMSSAIMEMLDWNQTGRRFYLLDTFSGIDERYLTDEDRSVGVLERNRHDIDTGFYTFDLEAVRQNYASWHNAIIIPGPVPETLSQIDSSGFAFVHLDMNCAAPEVAAAEFIWPLLAPGGIILCDDYAYFGYRSQKLAMDEFARSKSVQVLSLPTGQGLIIKPAA